MEENRVSPLDIGEEKFRELGTKLADRISGLTSSMSERLVTKGEKPSSIRKMLQNFQFNEGGRDADDLLNQTADILFDYSLFNGHPRFWGYITSTPASIGILGDFLASAVNQNTGAQILSPVATEIEKQAIAWMAEFIGYTPECGGILVSGGNMANFTGFLAGRTAKAPDDFEQKGFSGDASKMRIYCATTIHTWIDKAAILFGHGTDAVRQIPVNEKNQMDNSILEEAIKKDLGEGLKPFMVIGTAGDVSTGVVDDLEGISKICKKFDLWFHVDGAYGAPAAILPELNEMFKGLAEADSIAMDPHKWLYAPLEAGCTLVKNPQHLIDAYSSHPVYYNFHTVEGDSYQNFYELGLQNSRGFRALKVWLQLQQVGKEGYREMIRDDVKLAGYLYDLANESKELVAETHSLSITTFRYVPEGFETSHDDEFLNKLNEELVNRLQAEGEVFLSNALVLDKYCSRVCIVNFRTEKKDIEFLVELAAKKGRELYQEMKS